MLRMLPALVKHARTSPKKNAFAYKTFYLCFPILDRGELVQDYGLAGGKCGWVGFAHTDHGYKDQRPLSVWAIDRLSDAGIEVGIDGVRSIFLIAMPRLFGYVFNPVSFWVCLDDDDTMKAVLAQVNNTFGETHTYICRVDKSNDEQSTDGWITAAKEFHVSPFMDRTGGYRFRFTFAEDCFRAEINHHDPAGATLLYTALCGEMTPATPRGINAYLLRNPLITLRVMLLIHWQALKLFCKGLKFYPLPKQYKRRSTLSDKSTEQQ